MSATSTNAPPTFPKELIKILQISTETLIHLTEMEAALSRRQIANTAKEFAIQQKKDSLEEGAIDREQQNDVIIEMLEDLLEDCKHADDLSKALDRLNAPAMKVRDTALALITRAKEESASCDETVQEEQPRADMWGMLKELRTQSTELQEQLDSLIDAQAAELASSSGDDSPSSESEEES